MNSLNHIIFDPSFIFWPQATEENILFKIVRPLGVLIATKGFTLCTPHKKGYRIFFSFND